MIYTRCVMIIHLPVKRSALQISTIIAYAKPSIKLINTANLNVLWLPIITLFDHIYSFTDDAFRFLSLSIDVSIVLNNGCNKLTFGTTRIASKANQRIAK